MNYDKHQAMRGQSAIDHMAYRHKETLERMNQPFTRTSLTEWLNASREPWRLYFPHRPDDMPPKGGNPEALAKLEKELYPVEDGLTGPWSLKR